MTNISSIPNAANGAFSLNATIFPYGSDKGLDISMIIGAFSLAESIENDSIRGSISLADGTGLLSGFPFPLRGEERLLLSFKDSFGDGYDLEVFVWSISDIKHAENQSVVMYNLNFTSIPKIRASVKRITKAFEGTAKDIATQIFDETFNSRTFPAQLTSEETDGNLKVVVPNFTGTQAMDFIATRANGTSKSPASSFRFFERAGEGFFFVSDEWLIKNAEDNDKVFQLTQVRSPTLDGTDLEILRANITSISQSEHTNTLKDHQSGAYKNKLIEIDMYRRIATEHIYDKREDDSKFTTPGVVSVPRHSDIFVDDFLASQNNERKFLYFKDSASIGDLPGTIKPEENIAKYVGPRLAYRAMLQGNALGITLDGRFDIHAGDMADLLIPDFMGTNERDLNQKLSGKYLVVSVAHIGSGDRFNTALTLAKYEWSQAQNA